MAVWLAHQTYDNGASRHPDKDVISATTLLKSPRQVILSARLPADAAPPDPLTRVKARIGSAIHESIERAWTTDLATTLAALGYPPSFAARIRVNPEPGSLTLGQIPVYLEQRFFREILVDGRPVTVSGQVDQIIAGELNDTKTTSTYTWIQGSKTEDYRLQGSIYRWLVPDLVTHDIMRIQHIFLDWSASLAQARSDYPPAQVIETPIPLMRPAEIEAWMRTRLRALIQSQDLPEPELPRCTDAELWMSPPVFKFYADPTKIASGGKSTKNFPSYPAAMAWRNRQGKGAVVSVPGRARACAWCPAAPLCSQKADYGYGEAGQAPDLADSPADPVPDLASE